MKKEPLIAIFASTLLVSLSVSLSFVGADIVDVSGGGIATGPYIMSPTNTTYSSGFIALNVSFHAAIYGNMNYSMTYSLDGGKNETVPLTLHYFGFDHQDKNYIDGLASLPELSETKHNLTIYLKLDMYGSVNNQTYDKIYHDSQTVFFGIMSTSSPSPTPSSTPIVPEFSSIIIISTILITATLLWTILARERKSKIKLREQEQVKREEQRGRRRARFKRKLTSCLTNHLQTIRFLLFQSSRGS